MRKAPDAYLVAYQRFKLEWMLSHGYTLEALMKELDEIRDDMGPDATISDLFDTWERDVGFGSEIWPCFGEWQECEAKEAENGASNLRERLGRCLKIAESREDLSCHESQIKKAIEELEEHPYTVNPMMEVWCDYFLEKNEVKGPGTHHIFLTCPRCGDRNWFKKEDGWECAACGELADPEDMCSEAVDV